MESTDQRSEGSEVVASSGRRGKQIAILTVIVSLIVLVTVDIALKSCTLVEKEKDALLRISCELGLDNTETVRNVTLFDCSAGEEEGGWNGRPASVASADLYTCEKESSCTEVGIATYVDWIAENPEVGALVTIVVYATATVAFVPGSLLTIGSGAAFSSALGIGLGVVVAAISVVIGATIGGILAFLGGRYLFRDTVSAWSKKYKTLTAIDQAMEEEGLKIVTLLRLSPIIPFNAFNYIMGSTGCSLKDYSIATLFGIMPGTTGFVFIGSAVATAASGGSASCNEDDSSGQVTTILLIVGIIATIVAVVLITYYAKKKLNQLLVGEGDEGDSDSAAKDVEIEAATM